MDAKEKGKDLVETMGLHFGESYGYNLNKAKQCALIAINEIIEELDGIYTRETEGRKLYWEEVKEEVEKGND